MFDDKIKNFFENERAEIEKHKFRLVFSFLLLLATIIFVFTNFDDNEEEELNLNETPSIEEKTAVEKNLPTEKQPEVKKVSEENIVPVIGANSEILFVRDPFKLSESEIETEKTAEEKKVEQPTVEEKVSTVSAPSVIFSPPELTKKSSPPSEETEFFALSGTAIGENQKTALVKHFKKDKFTETLMLTVGDTLNGKKIIEITEDFLQLDGGEKIYLSLQ